MINIKDLTKEDIGRSITYHRTKEFGNLTSWNDKYIFVKFKGPTGEACEPDDVSFTIPRDQHEIHRIRRIT